MTDSFYWRERPVLVTGAGGFIGSHLIEALVNVGAEVRAFVRYNSRGDPGLLRMLSPELLARLTMVRGDLLDLPALQEAMRGVSHVFHLGAMISIPYSYVHPQEVVAANVVGTLNVLLAARELRVDRVVHTSTSEVYGTPQTVPIAEDHPLQGQSPYSASKIGADKIVESFHCAYDLPAVTVRPFNTYGPRQSARAVIPTIITQALTQDTVRLGNLETRRDFTYVSDTVAGFLKCGEASGVEGMTFNLGAGREVRIRDLVDQVLQILDKKVAVEVDPVRVRPEKSEVQRLLADNSLARKRLDWHPRVEFRDGLERTVAWVRGHLDCYQSGVYSR